MMTGNAPEADTETWFLVAVHSQRCYLQRMVNGKESAGRQADDALQTIAPERFCHCDGKF